MLNMLRDSLKESMWPKWILLAVAATMVLYLGQLFSCDEGPAATRGDWAAMINGQPISQRALVDEARQIDRSYQQLLGTSYGQLKSQFQIGTQAVQRLITRELMLQDARRIGFTVTPEEVIERVRSMPELQDGQGRFVGKQEYLRRLRGLGMTPDHFEAQIAEELLVGKWVHAMTQGVTVAEDDLEREFRNRTEKTAIDYVIVASADQTSDTKIDDAELQRYFDEHGDRYMRDPGRRIRYLVVERQAQLDRIQLTDDEVREYYEANRGNFTHPEQRRVRHILFRVDPDADDAKRAGIREQAEKVLARLKAGEDFTALARSMSQDPGSAANGGDLGWFQRGDMVPEFDRAAFETPEGELAPVVETQYGMHVLQVTGARDAGTLPFEDVEARIRPELRLKRAQEAVQAEIALLRSEIATPEDLAAVAAREGFALHTLFVNPKQGYDAIGASTAFRDAVEQLQPGQVSDPLAIGSGMALVTVDEVLPRSVAPLDEVESRVRTDLLNDRARRAAMDLAQRALDRGKTLAGAASRLGKDVQSSGDLAPGQGLPGTGGLSPEFEARLFGDEIQSGETGVVAVPAGALVYEVTRREPFDPAAYAAARDELRAELIDQRRNDVVTSLLVEMEKNQEILINDEAVKRYNG